MWHLSSFPSWITDMQFISREHNVVHTVSTCASVTKGKKIQSDMNGNIQKLQHEFLAFPFFSLATHDSRSNQITIQRYKQSQITSPQQPLSTWLLVKTPPFLWFL